MVLIFWASAKSSNPFSPKKAASSLSPAATSESSGTPFAQNATLLAADPSTLSPAAPSGNPFTRSNSTDGVQSRTAAALAMADAAAALAASVEIPEAAVTLSPAETKPISSPQTDPAPPSTSVSFNYPIILF
jgi:hypothetical protein